MSRELSDTSVRIQAETFLDWSTRRRGCDLAAQFDIWARSKDLGREDRRAIAGALVTLGALVENV